MVAFLAAAGAMLKGAARSAFKGIRRSGDVFTNVRKRFTRQAQRYEKMATGASGIEKSRLEALARNSLEKAIATYEDPTKGRYTKAITELSERLNPRIPVKKNLQYRESLIMQSESALASAYTDEESRREAEAVSILNSKVGDRVYAGLVDLWENVGYSERNQAIMDYFGVDSMADVLDMLEQAGIDIYRDPKSLERYDEIKQAVERFALDRR